MERFTDSQTWIVVFDKCHGQAWYRYFLHPKFGHVHLLREINGKCLMVNSFLHVLAVKEYPNTLCEMIQAEAERGVTAMVQFTVHYSSHYRPGYLEPITCVSVAKRILGIRRRLITPKALYHELIRAGALVIKPYVVL